MKSKQLEFLKKNIDERIVNIENKRIHYKKIASYFFFGTTIISALTVILLALNIERYLDIIRIIALTLTSIISVINSFNAYYNYKELWIANNSALNKLYELKFNILYFEEGNENCDLTVLESFKLIYQQTLNELNQNWRKNREDKGGSANKETSEALLA